MWRTSPRTTEDRIIDLQELGYPTAELPQGFDDPNSDFYISEELRLHYPSAHQEAVRKMRVTMATLRQAPEMLANSSTFSPVAETATHLAEKMALERFGELGEAPNYGFGRTLTKSQASEIGEWNSLLAERDKFFAETRSSLIESDFDRLVALTNHRNALSGASTKAKRAEDSEKRRLAAVKEQTCPICGVVADTERAGFPVRLRRRYPASTMYEHEQVRSCAHCYAEIVKQDHEAAMSERSSDFRWPNRREAVRHFLTAAPAEE